MTDADWASLVRDFVERRFGEPDFHDRFFAAWGRLSANDWQCVPPSAVETLFYVVEA
jgi:hypothetical protein